MNLEERLDLLMSLASDEREGTGGRGATVAPPRIRNARGAGAPPRIPNARGAGALAPLNLRPVRAGQSGPKATLLRILMTNACSFNCHYCPMRRDRDLPRTLLKPAEMVRIFLEAVRRGWCTGLFITTGIPGRPTKIADDLIEVLELLRLRYRFRGYVHVKLVPGTEDTQVDRITELASRVSLNLETPCGASLAEIAPDKVFEASLATLQRARSRVVAAQGDERDGAPTDGLRPGGVAGMTTQFVVGASADTDRAIIGRAVDLYRGGGVHHAHFSAFRPIRDTPLEHSKATPALREHRLYQADHLLRRYGFSASELSFDSAGNLPLARDPKLAWALSHADAFPVELRTATYSQLIRVPGVGPATARVIVTNRRQLTLRGSYDLRQLGVLTERAAGFLALGGRRLGASRLAEQLAFWSPDDDVGAFAGTFEFSPGTVR